MKPRLLLLGLVFLALPARSQPPAPPELDPYLPLFLQLPLDAEIEAILMGVWPKPAVAPLPEAVSVSPSGRRPDGPVPIPLSALRGASPEAVSVGPPRSPAAPDVPSTVRVASVPAGTGTPAGVAPGLAPGAGGPAVVAPITSVALSALPAGVLPPPPAAGAPVPAGVAPSVPPSTAVAVASVSGTGLAPGALPSATGLGTVDATTMLLLTRLRAGDQGPDVQAALARHSGEELLDWLDQLGSRPLDAGARIALVNVLLDRGALKPARPDSLSPTQLFALAEALAVRSDGRCVALYERLLAARQPAAADVPELAGLAGYYQRTGRTAKAAETLLRAPRYSTWKAYLANCLIDAGRAYQMAKQYEQADAVYAQVAAYGYGWATGMALVDRATRLVHQRQFAEARAVLDQPVTGHYAEQIAVAIEFVRAQAYTGEGDEPGAKRGYEAVLAKAEACGGLLPGEGLQDLVAAARKALARSAGEKP